MTPEARIAHSSAGRLRLTFPGSRGDEGSLASIQRQMEECPGIRSMTANPLTGSILILHETERETIEKYAADRGIFSLVVNTPARARSAVNVSSSVADLDERVRALTSGGMDLRLAVVLALVGSGLYQLVRGNAGALPWHAAFWYAFNIFVQSPETRKENKA